MLSSLASIRKLATGEPAITSVPQEPFEVPASAAKSTAVSLAPAPVGLNDSLPTGVGALYVSDHGSEDKISIHAFFESVEPYGPREHGAPRRGIQVEDAKHPKEIYRRMSAFSFGLRELKAWFLKVVKHAICLVIYDKSQRPIPWEMFRLSTTDKHFLGGRITTVRWMDVPDDADPDATKNVEQQFEPDECRGKVVSYVDPGESKKIAGSLKFLDDLTPVSFESPFELCKSLYEKHSDCGLVFMFCHGYVGDSIDSIALGPQQGEKLLLEHLREKKLHRIRLSRAIVFLNACNSGRLMSEHEYLCDTYRRSFCEVFLSKGARGVIATLDKVEVEKAGEFARLLWESISNHPDRPLACHLRELRAAALATVKENDDPTDEQFRDWLNRHLYVYYGNPNTVLRLTPGGCNDG